MKTETAHNHSSAVRLARLPMAARYAIALAVVVIAAVVRWALNPVWGALELPFITFYPGVMLTAWLGGFGPGLLTTFLSAALADYFWLSPPFAFGISDNAASDIASLLLFVTMGTLISVLSEAWRREAVAVARSEERLGSTLARIGDAAIVQRQAEERQRFLAEASRVLTSSLDYETTLAHIVNLVVPGLSDGCSIDVLDADGVVRHRKGAFSDPAKAELMRKLRLLYPYDPSIGDPVMERLKTGESVLFHEMPVDVAESPPARPPRHLEMMRALGVKSAMIAPFRSQDRSLGLLTFMVTESARRYTASDLDLAEGLAARAVLALENALLHSSVQEQRNEAEKATRLKDEFLAMVSHELRTPMSSILGWARLLRDGKLEPDTAKRALDAIERNATAQARLIDDLLDMSRIISAKLRMEVEPVDLAAIILDVVDSLKPAADAKSIHLQTTLDPAVGSISGDPARLRQVVWNLMSNALKFTSRGGAVEVRLDLSDSRVRIAVVDNGIGIDADFLPHVFERLRQANISSNRGQGGLGLGLAIVQHIVDLHGGSVEAHSAGEGRGARFVVQLPIPSLGIPLRAGPRKTQAAGQDGK